MGLIKAGIGALGGVLADQWKEFFYCDALDSDTLMVKGQKRVSGRSSNTKGSDNIISNGSGIAVADGQCMMIVEQGKVLEVCAEPGEYTFDSSTEPSIFAGSFGQSLIDTFTFYIKNTHIGVGECLAKYEFGVRTERCCPLLVAGILVDEGDLYAHFREGHTKEVVCAAVDTGGSDHMITCVADIETCEEVCCLT